jgi:aldehyde dehydrogenase (NAD+)
MAGVFAATGQTCLAGSRVLVQDRIYEEFAARLVESTQRLVLGDPLEASSDVGPVASHAQLDKVLSYVDLGVAEGATLAAGGHRPTMPDTLARGLFVEPAVFTDVQNTSRLAQEEIFGPVVGLIRFTDEDDAVATANAVDFGLAASVWTSDVGRAHRMVKRLRAGTVWVNTYRTGSYALPFGGYKASGIGRELGIDALEPYSETKSVWIDEGNQQTFGRH